MQKSNWSIILGCLIIAIGIIVAGQSIAAAINNQPSASSVLDVYNHDDNSVYGVNGDFLYDNEAADYLKIQQETLQQWIQSGKLKGTYTTVEYFADDENGQTVKAGTEYIFSKAKLAEFMNNLINS